MKKSFVLIMASLLGWGYSTMAQARVVPKKAVNLTDFQNFERSKVVQSVTTAPLTQEQKDRVALFNAYLVKACLYRLNPAAYPMTQDENSPERKVLRIVNAISAKRFAKRRPVIEKFVSAADPKRQKLTGRFNNFDFTKPALEPQMTAMSDKQYSFNVANLFKNARRLSEYLNNRRDYSSVDFIFRALHCVDETNPESGTDDMVLGGTMFEINQTASAANGLFCGEFDEKDPDEPHPDYPYYQQYGDYFFASAPFTSNTYPKTYYCVLALVEQDSDESGEELAHDINNAMAEIGGKICDAYIPGCSAVIGELAEIVNSIISTFFDDDPFPPYTVSLTLNSKNDFGDDLQSDNLATTPINGHGGQYKIGFKWRLRK